MVTPEDKPKYHAIERSLNLDSAPSQIKQNNNKNRKFHNKHCDADLILNKDKSAKHYPKSKFNQ
jgi:hypothetical protein